MKLNVLLQGVAVRACCGSQGVEITSVSYDTRTMEPGGLFVALPGEKTDGHRFILEALAKGAVAVVCQRAPSTPGPWLVVADARVALAQISANWFGRPAREMTCLAVTGTNGKTTTTYLLKAVLQAGLGAKVGLIGTNQNLVGNQALPAQLTTPESYELQGLLRTMADAGCTHVVMEASSIALDQGRTLGIDFAAGIFTNLTQDHLDYHGTMEDYYRAKARLFDQCRVAILNLDDPAGVRLSQEVPCRVRTYSERKNQADLVAKGLRLYPDHITFEAVTLGEIHRVYLPIPGGFTLYNALGVMACAMELGMDLADIVSALARAEGVRGRIEVVPVPAEFTVIIDYAHTPNALENILTTVRSLTQGRVICLFGCGGERDVTKRPMMGAIATSLAELTIVTSDNPRGENPRTIVDDILVGMGEGAYLVELDRRRAIALALEEARPGDVVVLAGKGHEPYQITHQGKQHLDEREEVAAYFSARPGPWAPALPR